jgi:hypothetical protein
VSDYPRSALNRLVVMLVYKQPFLDWLGIADPNPLPMTWEDLQDDNDTLLAVVRSASASKLPPVHQGGQHQ